jgi:hypothetical protein
LASDFSIEQVSKGPNKKAKEAHAKEAHAKEAHVLDN